MMNDQPPAYPNSESFDHLFWDAFDWRHAFFVLLIITLAMFGDMLFTDSGRILSAPGLDMYAGELSGLDSAYRALRNGNVTPWSPHLFSGSSTLSTALYPPHLVYLFLSLPQAVNAGIALHVFLAGFFMYLWAAYRRLHPLACLLTAVLFMFSGPYFMHVFAGHVGNLCAMTWAPLIFFAIDGMMDRPSQKWALLGSFAVAMQILTGQYQYVYYMAIAVCLYGGGRLFFIAKRKYVILGLLAIPAGSLLLTAFQVLLVLTSSREGVRGTGVAAGFASMFSFPPENFITFVAPFFFGDIQDFPYWGRCYLWEMCLFTGVSGFFLALYGAVEGTVPDLRTERSGVVESGLSPEKRTRQGLITMIMILMILALGAHTPLFKILFDWFPGFNKFRGTSKFMFFASLFWILLAGYGLDRLIRQEIFLRKFFVIPLTAALIMGGMAAWIFSTATATATGSLWGGIVQSVAGSGESYFPFSLFKNGAFLAEASRFSALGLGVAAGSCLIVAGLLFLSRSSRRAIYVLILLAVIEMFTFARLNRPTFAYNDLLISQFKAFYKAHPGDYRVLSFVNANTAMSTGAQDIWGYGPMAMGRYVQFMAWTQGADPDTATTYLKIRQYHPLFKMLRLRYILTPGEKGVTVQEYPGWMPRTSLVQDWRAAGSRKEIFQELGKQTFDPRRTVVLERAPRFDKLTMSGKPLILSLSKDKPAFVTGQVKSDGKNTHAVLDSASDHLTIKANLATPAILLITDNYSRGWQVRSLSPSFQSQYEIMPANYTLIAIPLAAGEHLLRVEYRSLPFVIGAWVSAIAWLGFGGLLGLLWIGPRRSYRWGVTDNLRGIKNNFSS